MNTSRLGMFSLCNIECNKYIIRVEALYDGCTIIEVVTLSYSQDAMSRSNDSYIGDRNIVLYFNHGGIMVGVVTCELQPLSNGLPLSSTTLNKV